LERRSVWGRAKIYYIKSLAGAQHGQGYGYDKRHRPKGKLERAVEILARIAGFFYNSYKDPFNATFDPRDPKFRLVT
jgi:hypothetical protein